MSILDFKSGKKEFMTFQAYDDIKFTKKLGDEYKVMINPETFEKNMTISYQNLESVHKYSTSIGLFANMGAISYSFSLVLDGTGIVNPSKKDVQKELTDLTNVLFKKVNDGSYQPNYVSITYCHEIFNCVITSFKINYTLFNLDGTPLRATVTCSFSSACKVESNKEFDKTKSKQEKSWFENFSEVVATSMENECDSLFNLLGLK
jgi:hypothetical protein